MKNVVSLSLFFIMISVSSLVGAQQLAEWVESDPEQDRYKIALGYPVPIPVDTPLPFNGFRTYAGLHMRHQDLAATTPWVHPENIGETRAGRTIWAYRLGDNDFEDIYGFPEPATLTNGSIHPREWQSAEVATGILELIALNADDGFLYEYLAENVNMMVIPVLNIDGFLQTQRYPTQNWLDSDPQDPANDPNPSPRDGRMRRKNMLNVDEDINTFDDHLFGVDLNRQNPPYWAFNPNRSSPDPQSIVHHGEAAQSEPEIQALDFAAHLGPIDQLRMYTDIHSYSQVHAYITTDNTRLGRLTESVLGTFTNHHATFPAGKFYFFQTAQQTNNNVGIGLTDEYFTSVYEVPSWTLEVEPSRGFPSLPGAGADYGGVNENGHDGFILPDSEVNRVRTQLAESFAAAFYKQAGPASVQAVRIFDKETQALMFEAVWDKGDNRNRTLYVNQVMPISLNHQYESWIAFNKPMRWRNNGTVTTFPGVSPSLLGVNTRTEVNEQALKVTAASPAWLDQPGGAPGGYLNYRDDAFALDFHLPLDSVNLGLVPGETSANLGVVAWDMVGTLGDANPATAVYWDDGHWNQYESTQGADNDVGGEDTTVNFQVTNQAHVSPFLLEPGTAAAWGDIDRVGEGFVLEMLSDTLAVMFWFTYNELGEQDWYIAVGEVRGNRVVFPEVLQVSGGEFGENFNPELITEEVVGSARFLWTDCDNGSMDWHIGSKTGRQNLRRLTSIMGMNCGSPVENPPAMEVARFSGPWGDPTHDGEGFTVEVLENGTALVFWFSFGPDGKRRWYFGIGEPQGNTFVFDNMLTTVGGVFGDDFDPNQVDEVPWGSLELELDCDGGIARYEPTEEGFEAGSQNIRKILDLNAPGCHQ